MDPGYFKAYENLEVHDIMLKDRPRNEAYWKAISENKQYFKDRVVLDVGAGTGILSVFCAKAGAKLVFAVEASELAKVALEVVEENQLTSVVKVIHSRIENFILPASLGKVDVIVSEWMGFYLFHEGMLDSLIYARDVFLREDGMIFPFEATILVAPCTVPSLYKYYEEVEGVKMASFARKLRAQKSTKPELCALEEADLLTNSTVMLFMDLREVTLEEIQKIEFEHCLPANRAGRCEGFCIWFEVRFPYEEVWDAVSLMTGPDAPVTHWKQCVVVLPEEICFDVVKHEPIGFKITISRNAANVRWYDLEVEVKNPELMEHPLPCDCHMTKCIVLKAHLKKIEGDKCVTDSDEDVSIDEDNKIVKDVETDDDMQTDEGNQSTSQGQ